MGKSYFKRFVEWQNYVHYILNALFLVVEVLAFKLYGLGNFAMFLWLTLLIFLNDTVIHAIFWFLPKPWRWRD